MVAGCNEVSPTGNGTGLPCGSLAQPTIKRTDVKNAPVSQRWRCCAVGSGGLIPTTDFAVASIVLPFPLRLVNLAALDQLQRGLGLGSGQQRQRDGQHLGNLFQFHIVLH